MVGFIVLISAVVFFSCVQGSLLTEYSQED